MTTLTRATTKPPPLPGLVRLSPEFGPVTSEHLERISAENPGWKFEIDANGELVINVYAGDESSDVELELGSLLRHWRVLGGGGGRARGASAGYQLADDRGHGPLVQADVSWVSPERLAEATREQLRGAMDLAPDFIVEIRSPSDRLVDQQTKMDVWMHYGVRLGWLFDLDAHQVGIYRLNAEPELLDRPATLSGEDVMVGLEVDCAEIWRIVDEANAD